MKGFKLGLLYTLVLAVVIWLVFFQLKPAEVPFANLRPADTELTGILMNEKWSVETGVAASFVVFDFPESPETTESWINQRISVRGNLLPFQTTPEWQETLTQQIISANVQVIQFNEIPEMFDDLSVLNKYLSAIKGSGEAARRFLLALNAITPVKMVHLSGWDGFIARLPEAGFETTFLTASHYKNQIRGHNLPAWFELPVKNPAALQPQLAAALLHHEMTGFQLDLRNTPVTSQLLVYLHLLQQLNFISDFDYVWYTGTRNVGVLASETRFTAVAPESGLANLTAQILLRAGMPVELLPLERCYLTEYLSPFRILFLNYQDQYPSSPVFHENLAQWVRRGGVLVFHPGAPPVGDFWWQQQNLDSPMAHLYQALKLKPDIVPALYEYGKGAVIIAADVLNVTETNAAKIRDLVRQAVLEINQEHYEYQEQNYLYLKRGPFVIAAVFKNSVSEKLLEIPGHFIDCGTAELVLTDKKILQPGEVALLYNLKKVERLTGKVLISASAISAEKNEHSGFFFTSHGPAGTKCHTLVKLVAMPAKVQMTSANRRPVPFEIQWTSNEKLLRLIYENQGEPVNVQLLW